MAGIWLPLKAAGYDSYSVDLLLAKYLAGRKEGFLPQIIL